MELFGQHAKSAKRSVKEDDTAHQLKYTTPTIKHNGWNNKVWEHLSSGRIRKLVRVDWKWREVNPWQCRKTTKTKENKKKGGYKRLERRFTFSKSMDTNSKYKFINNCLHVIILMC